MIVDSPAGSSAILCTWKGFALRIAPSHMVARVDTHCTSSTHLLQNENPEPRTRNAVNTGLTLDGFYNPSYTALLLCNQDSEF